MSGFTEANAAPDVIITPANTTAVKILLLIFTSPFSFHSSLSALAELLWGHRDDGEEAEAVTACRGGDEDEARTCREPATLSIRDEDEARKSPARMMPLLPLLLLKLP